MVWVVSNLGQSCWHLCTPSYDTDTRWPVCLMDILSAVHLGREKYCHVTAFLTFQKRGWHLAFASLPNDSCLPPRQALLSWDEDAKERGRQGTDATFQRGPPGCPLPRGAVEGRRQGARYCLHSYFKEFVAPVQSKRRVSAHCLFSLP